MRSQDQRVNGRTADGHVWRSWDSMEAMRGFAGDDVAAAKYYPEDRSFLLEFEPTVTHYEIVGHS